jgi:hypothetical protein
MTSNPSNPVSPLPEADDLREVLISRVTDGVSVSADWDRLEDVARTDPNVWRDLAYAQHDQASLSRAVEPVIAAASRVELPQLEHMTLRLTSRSRSISTWAGWAAAAAIGLAWLGLPGTGFSDKRDSEGSQAGQTAGQSAGLGTGVVQSASDALQAYLNKGQENGQVIGQVPGKLLLEAKPLGEGKGYEVLYLRQILEKTTVPNLYPSGTDDSGGVVPIKAPLRPRASSSAT